MDIHKPKAAHSIREFLIEIGTIVCGILIALGLEQSLEWAHWREKVNLAREGLREEIAFDDGFLVQRQKVADCVARRLSLYETTIEEATRTGRIGRLPKGDFTLAGPLDNNQWQSERASQTLTHFPRSEQSDMGRYYSVIETYKQVWLPAEDAAWIHLSGLQSGPRAISSQELADMRYYLAEARWREAVVVATAKRNLGFSARLKIEPQDRGVGARERVCAGLTPPPAA